MNTPAYAMALQDGIIRVIFAKGTVITHDLIIAAIAEENQCFDTSKLDAVWDFRGCLAPESFGYSEIEQIVQFIDLRISRWSPRMAILVDSTVQYGLSRMYQMFVEQFPTDVAVFYEEGPALAWISRCD